MLGESFTESAAVILIKKLWQTTNSAVHPSIGSQSILSTPFAPPKRLVIPAQLPSFEMAIEQRTFQSSILFAKNEDVSKVLSQWKPLGCFQQ